MNRRIPIAKDAAQKAGFWTKKGLGQHLLRDATVVEAGLKALELETADLILEIGPGLGALTEFLLRPGIPVLAIEVDPKACEALKERFGGLAHFDLRQEDILQADLKAMIAQKGAQHLRIAANLPYYITTPVIAKLLEEEVPFERMAALTQWEVGQRLVAEADTEHRAAISVLVQFHCEVEILKKVPPGAFTPPPRVESALLLFKRRKGPAVDLKNRKRFFKIVRSGFGKRRKTLRNALKMAEDPGLQAAMAEGRMDAAFEKTGIDSGRRAETLTMGEWAALANQLGD